MRQMRWMLCAVAVVLGCGDDGVSALSELQANHAKWQSSGPASYSLTQRYLCGECLPDAGRVVVVTVTDGAIESRVFQDDGSPVTEDASRWRDVEGLFQVVMSAIEAGVHRLAVVYDPVFGYPRSISIDYDERLVDDEIGFIVSNFTAR